jgi:RNA polymerase sigma-B factor
MSAGSPGPVDADRVAVLVERLPESRDDLVAACRPLADAIARRFVGRGEQLDDLRQTAALGLVAAVDRFDPARADSFLSYVAVTVAGELRRHFRDRAAPIRVPRSVRQAGAQVLGAVEDLTQRLGRSPTVDEVAAATGLDVAAVLDARAAAVIAGAEPIVDDDLLPVADRDEFAFITDWAAVAPAITALDERERRILFLRFYRGLSQTEIANELGISQVHVSRLLSRSLRHLRAVSSA